MIELALNKVSKYYGATMVLEDITFEVYSGEKIGLIGRNGCGKSTLLKIIEGIENHDEGEIALRKGATIGYLDQIPSYEEDMKVIDVLNLAFDEIHKLSEEMKLLENKMALSQGKELEKILYKYDEIQKNFEASGGYEIEEKLSKICNGLKITDSFKERIFNSLSGGEKTTVILGKILLEAPDILLLDEPSNHLDLNSIEWLEDYLRDYKGVSIIVSHDRYFLDRVVNKVVEIEDKISTVYIGNYSEYVKEKDDRIMKMLEAYENQQKKIKSMEKSIKDLREWGRRADNNKFFRRAASMQKRLDKIDRISKPKTEKKNIKLEVELKNRSGKEVIRVKELCKRFNDKVLLDNADFLLTYGEKVALIGKNGTGKSTLLKILLRNFDERFNFEDYYQDSGIAELGASIKLAYLPQNVAFQNEDATVLECFREDIVITEGKAREYLARYMFFGEEVFKKVKNLSGGERSRLCLCKLMYNEVNLLILDEPTNHLDIDSREVLEECLSEFEGSIFFVSHDRYFINQICSSIVELNNGKLQHYNGNYEYYKSKVKENELKSTLTIKEKPVNKTNHKSFYEDKKMKSENKKKEKKLKNIEEEISSLEIRLKNIEIEMISDTLDYDSLNTLYEEKVSIENKLEKLLNEWEELISIIDS
ncbi:ATPase component of ABC transporter [Gottschalkia purinilytica]|uniref:ATPase component of ABC transporter n=1 Tax=Gottschalkia purinilytica TaxID=1503 RepID=A0A0L0WAA1_GOTPU|nr:ABC-F family ATP-binding cassette domain-containing protein [Gottschalkia purinilytica]KNF08367.1 ATPase component of ABC transporter [Gottschalkia purinilytica]